jgi:NAD(P)-dependent dehydrogenase (short-subunit alcohol dehydrogenase family)
MDLHLNGQTAIVTGASRGIGLAVTRGLVAEGVRVTAAARKSSAELDELARTGMVRAVEVDLAGPDGPVMLVAAAGDRVDILVNNVGSAPARTGGFGEITDEDWLASLTVNLMAAVRTTRAALPAMLAAGKGAIVNVSSANAFLPDPAVMDYSAAKAALASFSKSLSKEAGSHGIRVNTVSPGPVATDLWLGEHGVAATVSGATGAPGRRTSRGRQQVRWSPAGSAVQRKSPTWCSSWPATAPPTSLAPTSLSTAASSPPGNPACPAMHQPPRRQELS